jgi:hypothetical protein
MRKLEAEPLDIGSQAEPRNQSKWEAEPLDISSQAEPRNQSKWEAEPLDIGSQAEPRNQLNAVSKGKFWADSISDWYNRLRCF